MNRDQIFSALNYVFAFLATFLVARGVDTSTVKLVIGVLCIGASVAVGWWLNHGVAGDIILSAGRKLVAVVLAYLSFRGFITGETADAIVTGLGTLIPMILAMWGYSAAAGPNLPGTTIQDDDDSRTVWMQPPALPAPSAPPA